MIPSPATDLTRCNQDGCDGLLADGMCPYGYGASCRSTEVPRVVEAERG